MRLAGAFKASVLVKIMALSLLLGLTFPATAKTVLVVGDSISAGFGVPNGQGWVALWAKQQPELTLINASLSGETTRGGLTRLPALLAEHQPQLTIIELGGNDGLRGMPIKVIKSNLAQMIELVQQAGSQVLLLGMQIPPNYGAHYTDAFASQYAQLAQQFNVPLVPFFLEDIAGVDGLMQADGIHPTAEAQPILLKHVMGTALLGLSPQ